MTQNFRSNEELMAVCHNFLEQLQQAPWVVQRLYYTYGPMPSEPSSFSFWVALVLPIDEQEKAKLLRIRSARLRLRLVVHWIEQLNNNWCDIICREVLLIFILFRIGGSRADVSFFDRVTAGTFAAYLRMHTHHHPIIVVNFACLVRLISYTMFIGGKAVNFFCSSMIAAMI